LLLSSIEEKPFRDVAEKEFAVFCGKRRKNTLNILVAMKLKKAGCTY